MSQAEGLVYGETGRSVGLWADGLGLVRLVDWWTEGLVDWGLVVTEWRTDGLGMPDSWTGACTGVKCG